MSQRSFLETYHMAFGKNPVADFLSGTVTSDVVNMKNFDEVVFLFYWGVGTTGTATITVEACDDASASNTTAIPFRYRNITGAINAGDTHGAITDATTAGFTTTAGSHQVYAISVRAEEMGDTNYGYVRCKAVEVADDPILGGILILQGHPRFDVDDTTLT